jgi:hypothetical protein
MNTTVNGEWVVDLGTMSCQNNGLGVTIFFRIREKALGKKSLEMAGMKLICIGDKDKIPESVIKEAEKVFLTAYNENCKKNSYDDHVLDEIELLSEYL